MAGGNGADPGADTIENGGGPVQPGAAEEVAREPSNDWQVYTGDDIEPTVTADSWEVDSNGVHYTHDPESLYLIHPPNRLGEPYRIFWAIGQAIQFLGGAATLEQAKAGVRRHRAGEIEQPTAQ